MKRSNLLLSASIALSMMATGVRADCGLPTIGSSYSYYSENNTAVELVIGQFTELTEVSRLTEQVPLSAFGDDMIERTTATYEATVTGDSFSRFGFRKPFSEFVKVQSASYVPRLLIGDGGLPTLGRQGLIFLQRGPDGLKWSSPACVQGIFYEPTERQLNQASQCHLGIWCPKRG